MSINVFQAILIGLWTAFCFSGMLLGIYTNRCIVLSFGVGIILGDLPTALAMGAIGELAYMGFGVGAGGTVPPNPIGPGIFGTLMAITIVLVKSVQKRLLPSLLRLLWRFNSYKLSPTLYVLVRLKQR